MDSLAQLVERKYLHFTILKSNKVPIKTGT